MPQIIVTAGPTDQHGSGTVMLRERVNPADFESERFAANLVERLGWAVLDATEAERRQRDDLAPAEPPGRLVEESDREHEPGHRPLATV